MRPAIFLLLLLAPLLRSDEPASYWVWHRTSALQPDEVAGLQRQRAATLFWNVGEMELREGVWRWKARALDTAALAGPLHVVLVVRLSPETRKPFEAAAWAKLAVQLRGVADVRAAHCLRSRGDVPRADSELGVG